MLLAHVGLFHNAMQPVAFGFESGQPAASRANLTCKNHWSRRIMIQFSSTGGRQVPAVDPPPLGPSCRMHNLETGAEAVLSTRPIPDLPLSIQLRPYRRVGIESHLRSCSHITKPHSRYRRLLQNTWSIQNSCLPSQPVAEVREPSRQSSRRFLPRAGSE